MSLYPSQHKTLDVSVNHYVRQRIGDSLSTFTTVMAMLLKSFRVNFQHEHENVFKSCSMRVSKGHDNVMMRLLLKLTGAMPSGSI